jgi:hypothetical protein
MADLKAFQAANDVESNALLMITRIAVAAPFRGFMNV